jgi:thiosulfate/3-mercaptopyruvate sulfurtransferase
MRNKWLVDPEYCAEKLSSANVKIVDCRYSLADFEWGRSEYKNAHIPGSVYAHMDEDLSGEIKPGITGRHPLPDANVLIEKLAEWGIGNEDHVIAYDQAHGGLAARVWWMLRWVGHENVSVLNGGWAEWQKLNLPESSNTPIVERGRFVGKPNQKMAVNMKDVTNWIDDPAHVFIDARAHIRYTGENEPIDPVAGHVPGAVSKPFLENINENGRWKSAEELKARFEDTITGNPEDTAVYCGSGVTACHNLLALEVAGFHGAKLYPGSWSEWVASGNNAIVSFG